MLQQEDQTQSTNFEWACQALSATGEPCETSATCHCGVLSGMVLRSPRRRRSVASLCSRAR